MSELERARAQIEGLVATLEGGKLNGPARQEARLRSWREPFDAPAWARGDRTRLAPSLLHREDGAALLYRGRVNELHGEPEVGKGYVAGYAAAEVLRAGAAAWIDFDLDPEGVVERVIAGGATADELERLHVYAIEEPLPLPTAGGVVSLGPEGEEALAAITDTPELGLVVVDGLNAGLALHGLDPRSEVDVATLTRLLLWKIRRPEVAVLVIDHVVKDRESRGRFASGSIHKLNVIDGAAYQVKALEQPAPGRLGRLRLVVSKDRHGGVRASALRQGGDDVAAVLAVDSTGPEPVVSLEQPTENDTFRPTYLMERVSRYLEELGEPASKRQIEDTIEGKRAYIRRALEELVGAGHVEAEEGARGAVLHRSVSAYREGQS